MSLVHLYYGEGKGKSTAAAGLALRALSAGWRVIIIRLLKGGIDSGETELLKKSGAEIINGKLFDRFTGGLNDEEKKETRNRQNDILKGLFSEGDDKDTPQLLVLDEALAACNLGMVDEELLKELVIKRPENREVVLTGRGPAEWMLEEADYITEFKCIRHPYEKGITARKGIEY